MKLHYLLMSKPPNKRLPRKAKKRITKTIKAGYSNKYSSAKIAIQDWNKSVNSFHENTRRWFALSNISYSQTPEGGIIITADSPGGTIH
jgi:hypothetical protein